MESGALFNPGFLGGHFLWWVGQIADDSVWRGNRNADKFQKPEDIPGWGRRYKVRIIGLHDRDESSIPSDQLPWAQVMYPITAGGGQAGSFQSPALKQGNFVFGFFLDGQDQQVPVIMGILGNNEQTALKMKTGLTGGKNFSPTSGHANQTQDQTKITADKDLSTAEPPQGSSAAKEPGGGDDHQENAADKKENGVLDKKHALSSPDPECKTAMTGIRVVIENLQKKIEEYQQAMRSFSAGVSLKTKEISKDIDKAIQDASKEISKFMKDIYGKIQEWVTDQYNKKIKPLLKISIPTFRIKLLELNIQGLETICCLFNKLAGLLLGLIAAALSNRLNNQKNQSPPPPAGQPQLTSPGSNVVPPLPPDNYYRPVPICTAEELVADVLSGTLNDIMQGFDSAIAPVVYEVQNSLASAGSSDGQLQAGSTGSSTVPSGITQDAVAAALQSGSLVNALSSVLASSFGVNPAIIGSATNSFRFGNYAQGLSTLAFLAGKDTGVYATALVSATQSINNNDLVGGLTTIAGALGANPTVLSNVGSAFDAIRTGNITALTSSVGQLAGVNPQVLGAVQQAGAAFAAGDIRGLAGQLGGLAGLNFDIAAAMDFISSLTTLFDCDPKPQCSPNTEHTLQQGGNANPGKEKPSSSQVAANAIESLESTAAGNANAQAVAESFNQQFAVPSRTIQPGEGGGA